VAVSKVHGPAAALAMIEPLAESLSSYFHFHGVKGAMLQQLERNDEARVAFERAVALANTAAEAAHIRSQIDRLTGAPGSAPEATSSRKKSPHCA
ncbi:MAG: RNA polymerase sigma factor, partial [Povalibacter sp.]